MKIIIISLFSLFFISGCSSVYSESFDEVVFFNGSSIPFETDSKYLRVCLNVSNYEREDIIEYDLTPMTSGLLGRDEFLFYINSYAEYPNLGVIARNGDCFFSELIYYMNNFSFVYVNESITGSLIITHYSNYVEFIQDKYDDSVLPDNDLPSVYLSAINMARESSPGRLSIVEPHSRLHPIRIHIRGGYGRASPKKSYSVHFLEEVNIHGIEGRVLYLQSQFNDPNLNRNDVALRIYEALGYITPQVVFVNVFFNERYIGVYELTNRIDKDLLGFDFALNDPTRVYKINFYGNDCTLAGSIQTDMSLCDDNISLDVMQAIDYYLLTKITGATDNIGKNYFLSVDEFDVANILPWDLDYTFHRVSASQTLVGFTYNEYLTPIIEENLDLVVSRYYELRETLWSDDNLIELASPVVELDSTLNYETYVFPERLPLVNLTEHILQRVAFLDDDFRSVVLDDFVDLN